MKGVKRKLGNGFWMSNQKEKWRWNKEEKRMTEGERANTVQEWNRKQNTVKEE